MIRSSRWQGSCVVVLGFICLISREVFALETVTIGENGDLDWQGKGSVPVSTIGAEYLAPPDPNNPGGTPRFLVGNAPGGLLEFENPDFPHSILPKRVVECPEGTCPEANIADGTLARGGTIRMPTFSDFSLQYKKPDFNADLEEIISSETGGEEVAIELKNYNAFGQLLLLDMGARFGVNRIRFYPRNTVRRSPATPFQDDFLRAYETFTNDGINLTAEGVQIWEPLVMARDNRSSVVDIVIDPPRYVRSIRLKSLTQFNWELDEIEVYGKGFLPTASFISDIFDVGAPAAWVRLRWVEEIAGDPEFSRMQIRTRTGTDDSPFVFTRKLRGKPGAEEIPFSLEDSTGEMTRAEYERLPQFDAKGLEWEPASVQNDLVNWSPFSTPFPASTANGPGSPIISPSPRRYFQFQVLLQSSDLEAARVLRSLSFDFLAPPLADKLIGEIFPREVEPSIALSFTYAVRPVMQTAGLRGFDTMEISTPTQVESIDRLEVLDADGQVVAGRDFASLADTTPMDGFQIVAVNDDNFMVRFPLIQEDAAQVRILFRTSVLTYSTNFSAFARVSTEPEASQAVASGDAALLGTDDRPDLSGTTVLSPQVQRGGILTRVELVPNPFTPNGDGINDEIAVRYSLLSLSVPRPVNISVYDLAGQLVHTLFDGSETNGRYEDKVWNGRDWRGQLVEPGIYIVRISADGDAQTDAQVHVVSVAY